MEPQNSKPSRDPCHPHVDRASNCSPSQSASTGRKVSLVAALLRSAGREPCDQRRTALPYNCQTYIKVKEGQGCGHREHSPCDDQVPAEPGPNQQLQQMDVLLMIQILHECRYQNPITRGSRIYIRSCRTFTIKTSAKMPSSSSRTQ